jgi:hypothetical protein
LTAHELRLAKFFAQLGSIPSPTERMSSQEAAAFEEKVRAAFDRESDRELDQLIKESGPDEKPSPTALERYDRRSATAIRQLNRRRSGLDRVPRSVRSALQREFLKLSSFVQRTSAVLEIPARGKERDRWIDTTCGHILPNLHLEVRRMLRELFEQGGTVIDPQQYPYFTKLRLVKGMLREVQDRPEPLTTSLVDFLTVLRLRPFPYGRCRACAEFFVQGGRRQRYCSAVCRARGTEAARKDTKREYMRKYMAMRRAKERNAQRKGR